MRKQCAPDKAATYQINQRLAKILVRKLTTQKRSLIRAIKEAVFELGMVSNNHFGETNEWLTAAVKRLEKTVKKNSPKPSLFS